jgi:hypothetical protein
MYVRAVSRSSLPSGTGPVFGELLRDGLLGHDDNPLPAQEPTRLASRAEPRANQRAFPLGRLRTSYTQ